MKFSGSGLGRGVAKRLAALGATVVIWDVNETGNEQTKSEILNANRDAKIHSMRVNLCDRKEIYRAAEKVKHLFFLQFFKKKFSFGFQVKQDIGDVTIVINNAGVVSGKPLLEIDDASIQRTFDVNVIAHFWVSHRSIDFSIIYKSIDYSGSQSISGSNDCCKSRTYCNNCFGCWYFRLVLKFLLFELFDRDLTYFFFVVLINNYRNSSIDRLLFIEICSRRFTRFIDF